jgi:hypothetical protein
MLSRDTLYTQINQVWKAISGIVTLVMIPLFLTQEQQGYWFTMTSLAALAMLAELGFFQITLQFAAHEFAHLQMRDGAIVGDENYKSRLASLFVFCVKWALLVSAAAFPVIFIVGILFLSRRTSGVSWHLPWLVYLIGAAITFLTSALFCFLEGCGLVAAIQRLRFMVVVVTMAVTWAGLVLRLGLHALSLSMFVGACYGILALKRRYGSLFREFRKASRATSYSWKSHILSLLWRYAISWGAGYFIFQIYPPLVFEFSGPAESGKVGLSITLWMGVFAISNSWLYAVTPRLNMLVSKKDWRGLDSLFRKNLLLSAGTFVTGALAVLLLVSLLEGRLAIIDRFCDPLSMLLLSSIWLLQVFVNGLATYLRAHKQEPLVVLSALSAIYVTATTVLCAKYLPHEYLFLGWLSSYLWGIPWMVQIFKSRKLEWQAA